jgi:hypothetical protein
VVAEVEQQRLEALLVLMLEPVELVQVRALILLLLLELLDQLVL